MRDADESGLYDKLFRQALLIRRIEEKIIEVYPTDVIQSPVHLSIGQEAIAVGLCEALEERDLIFGSYRSHALYIGAGGDVSQMFAELMGRIGGISKGKAGSMHLCYPEGGLMGSSAVVATQLPHAVGSALAARFRKTGQVVVCMFGDGALEEGVTHESFNFAALRKLPVLFVCENNSLAVHSHIHHRQAFTIENFAKLYDFPYVSIEEGWDFMKVYRVCMQAIQEIREDGAPRFIEIKTFRYKEHVGTKDDFHRGYRSSEQLQKWQERDPLIQDRASLAKFLPGVDAEIAAAYTVAERSPAPGIDELLTDID